VIRVERSIHLRCALACATPFSLPPGHLEAFSLADQSKPISAHRHALAAKDRVDLAISEARISLGQLVNAMNELRFFDSA
jgi:hypothetical protein